MVAENKNIANDDDISLRELILKIGEWWKYLLSKWIVIVSFGILGGILGFAYAFLKKPIYTATTTFVLETGEKPGMGQYAGIASMMGIDLGSGGGGIFQGENILELYKSRTIIEKALLSPIDSISGELLISRYIEFNKLREAWAKKPELANLQFGTDILPDQKSTNLDGKLIRLRDSVLGKVVEDINNNYLTVAKPDKKLSIIQVDVKAKDEIFAKSFNEELVKNVNDFYVRTKTKKAIDNVSILQHKSDSVRAVMNGAIYSAVAVADATPNLNPTRQIQRVAPAQKAQFSAESNKAVLSTLVQNLEMAKITLLKETPLIQVVDYPVYPLKKDKLGKVKGTIIGGILLGILTVFFFTLKRFTEIF
jgi:Chain length determinant protein